MGKYDSTYAAWQEYAQTIRDANIAQFDIQAAEKLFNFPAVNRQKISRTEFIEISSALTARKFPKIVVPLRAFLELFSSYCVGAGNIDPEFVRMFTGEKEDEAMSKDIILGIDLGTTNSCVAYMDEFGRPQVLPNEEGKNTTPSVVFMETQGLDGIVGEQALNLWRAEPDKVATYMKRDMTPPREEGQKTIPKKYPFDSTPVQLSAIVLKKLVADANVALGRENNPIKDVVITVPAYFNQVGIQNTMKAGEEAGLNVVSLLQEPTAAALAYGFENTDDQTILVYDLGGGTFDVTILKIVKGEFYVLSIAGDQMLGGYEWDQRLAQRILEHYNQQWGTDFVFPVTDAQIAAADEKTAKMRASLMLEAENIKRTLSSRETASTAWLFQEDGHSLKKTEITRAEFDEMTSDLLKRTLDALTEAIDLAKEKAQETQNEDSPRFDGKIDKVLLVGGSSLMPQVKKAVQEYFNGVEVAVTDPHMIVAKGAAVYANGGKDPIEICAHTYGTDIQGGRVKNLIFKGDQLPAVGEFTFRTVTPDQKFVSVNVYQSEARKSDGIISEDETEVVEGGKKLTIRNPQPEPINVYVKFEVDKNGILRVLCRTDFEDEMSYELKI